MRTPRDLAHRMRQRKTDGYLRSKFTLPREEARAKAQEFFREYPKEAYMTKVEAWRELPDDQIDFRDFANKARARSSNPHNHWSVDALLENLTQAIRA